MKIKLGGKAEPGSFQQPSRYVSTWKRRAVMEKCLHAAAYAHKSDSTESSGWLYSTQKGDWMRNENNGKWLFVVYLVMRATNSSFCWLQKLSYVKRKNKSLNEYLTCGASSPSWISACLFCLHRNELLYKSQRRFIHWYSFILLYGDPLLTAKARKR